ncbi:MAG: DNA-processing protein DprA [Patescibacteria group bacterium]
MEVVNDIRVVDMTDAEYPAQLKEISDPPQKLYVRGNLDWRGDEMVAMVGSRKPTPYGIQVATVLAEKLANRCVIVSGLAYGVDSLAHQAVVNQKGVTVAVLGSGIDDESIYPPTNRELAKVILQNGGALISEYPAGTPPLKQHFPQRNRIIAGLSHKIVVVEAAEGSGALITARLGLDYNREVLAVPGQITNPNAFGPNQLIAEGAKPVLGPNDVVEAPMVAVANDLTELEQIIYDTLTSGAKTIDEIAQLTELTTSEINVIVTFLEMRGVIINAGMGKFGVRG